jgi:hypothetical protein
MYEERIWATLMRECPSLATWNTFIVPLMKVLPKPLRDVAAVEAKRRNYKANRDLGVYE